MLGDKWKTEGYIFMTAGDVNNRVGVYALMKENRPKMCPQKKVTDRDEVTQNFHI